MACVVGYLTEISGDGLSSVWDENSHPLSLKNGGNSDFPGLLSLQKAEKVETTSWFPLENSGLKES